MVLESESNASDASVDESDASVGLKEEASILGLFGIEDSSVGVVGDESIGSDVGDDESNGCPPQCRRTIGRMNWSFMGIFKRSTAKGAGQLFSGSR
jgi:hypothetical protein